MYVCLLDLTKAFDHVKHHTLFKKLSSKVPAIFLRLIMIIYLCQTGNVKWDNSYSSNFSVTNGVRQGAVASPLYFNVYLDDLFLSIKESGLGCHIGNYFYGLFGFADDCALLSPSRQGLQSMLDICSKYFSDHGIKISVNVIVEKSKTKCMAFNVNIVPAMLSLYDLSLPWVSTAVHLGHTFTTAEDTSADILSSKGLFNSKVHEFRQEFGDQHPVVFIKLVQIYLTSMYGSNLWDLYHPSANKLFSAWNSMIKYTYNLPFATHKQILYNITEQTHLRVSIIRRFVNFYKKLSLCSKPEIINLFYLQRNDVRSVFGRNIANICHEFNTNNMLDIKPRDICMPAPTDDSLTWLLPLLNDLILLRNDPRCDIPTNDILCMINDICCR